MHDLKRFRAFVGNYLDSNDPAEYFLLRSVHRLMIDIRSIK